MDQKLTPESALALVQPFFPNEWSKIGPKGVTLKIIAGGFVNSICVISRESSEMEPQSEPLSLLIKQKGGNMFNAEDLLINTDDTTLAIIAYEMGRRSLGPKVYGLIKGGWIEEYIDSHTLTSEESADPDISRDIALSLAAIHAIKGLPLKKTPDGAAINDLLEKIRTIPSKRPQYEEAAKKFEKLDLDFIFGFEFAQEINWLINKINQLQMRKNFILNDMNYLNCLVLNDANKIDGDMDANERRMRVILIDYDMAHHDYRGFDLGIHFLNRVFNFGAKDEKIIQGASFPSEEEKRRFLAIYQQEIKRLNVWNDFDEDGVDSVDNLLIESLIGQCYYCLIFSSHMLSKPHIFLAHDPAFLPVFQFMLRNYLAVKEDILKLTE